MTTPMTFDDEELDSNYQQAAFGGLENMCWLDPTEEEQTRSWAEARGLAWPPSEASYEEVVTMPALLATRESGNHRWHNPERSFTGMQLNGEPYGGSD